MTMIYFEDESGYVLQVEPDCPCSRDGKLLLAKDVLMGKDVEVHTGDGWFKAARCNPNKTLTFILNVEVPDWAKPRDVYRKIDDALRDMRRTHTELFTSHTLASQKPLDE